MFWRPKVVVAIPVKDEEARIGLCLNALAAQTADFDQIVLLLNNCTDKTLEICKQFADRFGKTKIFEQALYGSFASAGEARRLVLSRAAEIVGAGIILTTDADAIPDADWIAANLAELEGGADAVCGMAKLDPADAPDIPMALQLDEKNEVALMSLQDEIAAVIDPEEADPWPRHQADSGASLALRAGILRSAGGAPHVATGEDRALIERLRLVDARIRHAPGITVAVSGRLEGRAEGGMAATLKRRMRQPDLWTDGRLEPTVDAYRRILARLRLRQVIFGPEDADALAEDLLITPGGMRHVMRAPFFGAAWAEVQRLSPVLQRRRVEFAILKREIRQAIALRDRLRAEVKLSRAARPRRDREGSLSSDENAR